MDCIRVWFKDGIYDYIPDAIVECWADVIYECDDFFHVERLKGWGKYTDCYRVEFQGKTHFYFVELPQW